MEEKIADYLINERGLVPAVAERVGKKVLRYDDIKAEFLHWLETRAYDAENPVIVNDYTAAQIAELNPNFDGIGVYNFLTDMRDDPEYAQQVISEGFIAN